MVRKGTAAVTAFGLFIAAIIVAKIVLVVGLVYVACHFIGKFW